MKIGFLAKNYPEIRCVINKTSNNEYNYIGYFSDPYFLFKRIMVKLRLKKTNWNDISVIKILLPFLIKDVDYFHTVNTICLTKRKWVTTFESIVPRTDEVVNRIVWDNKPDHVFDRITYDSLEALSEDNCIGLLALSEATKLLQLDFLNQIKFDENKKNKIREKIQVIHPPQEILVDKNFVVEKYTNMRETINFIFVGRLFFRKGGAEMIDELLKLKEEFSFDFTLTIISSLNFGDDASKTTEKDKIKYMKIIEEEEWITYFESVSNKEVLELCKKAHVGVLPTIADTYGYSVLEMQACGLPVITTNIRSLPEINNLNCGWICNLPLTNLREAKYSTESELEMTKKVLKSELNAIFRSIIDNKDNLLNLAISSLDRVKEEHNHKKYDELLNQLFK